MQICETMKSLRVAGVPVILILFGITVVVTAPAQATPPASAPVQLQPYTAPDKSASAGVPSGWQITNAGSGAIAMAGPQGEAVNVKVIVAHDGQFQLGQKGPNGADLTMPSSAKLSDKLVMVLQQQAAINGMPVPELKYLYAAPIQMPSGMGQCGMFAVRSAGGASPADGMGIFCSFADSSAKYFKSFLMYGAAPATIAAQSVPTVEAVFKSYKLAPGWTQKILSPYTPADATDPGPGGSGYPSAARASAADSTDPGPGGSGYPSAARASADDGPGNGGGYNPGPGGSGYPNNPPSANKVKSASDADDGPGLGGGYNPGPGLGGGYNPGPGGSAGYPNNPPSANRVKSAADADDGPGLGGGYNPGPGNGGGYNPGPGGSAGYPYNGTDPSESYSEVLWRNQQAIDHGFVCAGANIIGNGSPTQTPVECGGWKPNF
jgi:hypothetical protein